MQTNGVCAQDALEMDVVGVQRLQRDILSVIGRMINAIPQQEKPDRLLGMLTGMANAYRIYGCKETESVGWSQVVATLMQRMQMWGESDSQIPEWFNTVAAIFRGEK